MKTKSITNKKAGLRFCSSDGVLEQYRYFFTTSDAPEQVKLVIITDTPNGHVEYMKSLLKRPDIISAGREYLHSIDTSRVLVVDTFKSDKTRKKSEVNKDA